MQELNDTLGMTSEQCDPKTTITTTSKDNIFAFTHDDDDTQKVFAE